jgi:GAF domain-containing protein
VIPLGVALSSEKDFNRLLETILLEAKSFCRAGAGTLYLRTADDQLRHVIVRDDTRGIALGGTTGQAIDLSPLPLHDPATGAPNQRNAAAAVALSGSPANIPNIYAAPFDIDEPQDFDAATGEPSLLVLPLTNSVGQVVGVLELRNATASDGRIIPFDHNLEEMMESFSSLAGAAFEGYIREQSLRREIKQLQIEVNEVKRQQQVQEIVDSDFFQDLRTKARAIRKRGRAESDPAPPATDAPVTIGPASSDDEAASGSGGEHV